MRPWLARSAAVVGVVGLVSLHHATARADTQDVRATITDAAQARGVSPSLLLCVARRESGLDPLAVSPGGDEGLFQLSPLRTGLLGDFCARGFGDVWSAEDQAEYAALAFSEGLGPRWSTYPGCAA